jgi:tubulin alpha
MGNACWEVYCLARDIEPNGQIQSDKILGVVKANSTHSSVRLVQEDNKPRTLYVDLEPTVVGTYIKMYTLYIHDLRVITDSSVC